ncbi:MAG: O-acetylhomoserine aminocarboxypropyltransferase/cysteine synthase [Kiritimatiellaeota bacterium]|nr:O-acetylhomoserine aminocarboxypropyltransferase/cysteine synthase [Kiritimatiellota bacterium]
MQAVRKWSLATELVHPVVPYDPAAGGTALPVNLSVSFGYDSSEELAAAFSGERPGYVYARIQNPTIELFERHFAEIEHSVASVTTASGMAAIAAIVLAVAAPGDEIVAGTSLFGGTFVLLEELFGRYGVRTRFVEPTDPDRWRRAITDRTRLLFVEAIGNPKLDVPDIGALAELAAVHGVPLAVDATAATPALIRPGELGASLVIHSLTKYVGGHGAGLGGIVVDTGVYDWTAGRVEIPPEFLERYRRLAFAAFLRLRIQQHFGGCLAPFHAFLFTLGLETLALRMDQHCRNALALAQTLSAHPKVAEVRYPGLGTHPDHETARRQFGDRYGGLLTLRLGSQERCFRFMNRLRLAKRLANLGDVRTLVIHPASTFCREASPERAEAMGVSEDLVRVSVGIEAFEDLKSDFEQALEVL